jgi:hypothetical protein
MEARKSLSRIAHTAGCGIMRSPNTAPSLRGRMSSAA